MLARILKKRIPKIRMEDLSKLSGISTVRLYEISRNPDNKNIKYPTLEKIYRATELLYGKGKGIMPDEYLEGCIFKFKK